MLILTLFPQLMPAKSECCTRSFLRLLLIKRLRVKRMPLDIARTERAL